MVFSYPQFPSGKHLPLPSGKYLHLPYFLFAIPSCRRLSITSQQHLSVHLLLNFEPQLCKSKESNSEGIKVQVKRAFKR